MEVSSLNNYNTLVNYQRITTPKNPSILPIETPQEQEPQLTPEQQLELQKQLEALQEKKAQEEQEKKDTLRAFTMDYIGTQSKKTQFEIYLSGMLENDVDITNDINIIESLRDVKKQNELINGYATYKELQEKLENSFMV